MLQQMLACCLAGVLSLTGCVASQEISLPQEGGAALAQFAVKTAVYPDYPQFVQYRDYLPADSETQDEGDWERYWADREAYQAQVAALHGEQLSEDCREGVGRFALDTLARLLTHQEVENPVYSPVNLYVALSVLSEITGGDTRGQVLSVLGADSVEQLRGQCQTLWRQLYRDDGISKQVLANSLWLRQGFPFQEQVTDRLASDYYASTYQATMGPEADRAMRAWVNQQTGNTLDGQAGKLQTDPRNTVMVLLSTLYFYDQWRDPFQAAKTAPDVFTKADGKTVTCDFMHGGWTGSFLRTKDYTAAGRAFQQGGEMLFLLPNEGVSVSHLVDSGALNSLLWGGMRNGEVRFGEITLSVPRFDLSASLDWQEDLAAMGIQKAFDPAVSDFTPLTTEPEMFVKKVTQASRVKIDEVGCTASSFVEMEVEAGSALAQEECVLRLDRPFLFVIFSEEQIPLFIGVVNNPAITDNEA